MITQSVSGVRSLNFVNFLWHIVSVLKSLSTLVQSTFPETSTELQTDVNLIGCDTLCGITLNEIYH